MPGPTDPLCDWASDPFFPGTTDPNKITPPAANKQAGFEPGFKPPAQWMNAILHNFAEYIEYHGSFIDEVNDEYVYPVVKNREIRMSPMALSFDGNWDLNAINVLGSAVEANASFAQAFIDLKTVLPAGAVITQVDAMVEMGATANSFSLALIRPTYDYSVPEIVSGGSVLDSDFVTGVTGDQLATIVPVNVTAPLDFETHSYILSFGFSNPFLGDKIKGFRILFTDPGPRNY